jgi:MFS family permease
VRGVLHDRPGRTIVNIALPSIKTSLNVSDHSLQWVLIAYTITFGGLLLLGGRAADLLGRRRLFMIGVAVLRPGWAGVVYVGSPSLVVAAGAATETN